MSVLDKIDTATAVRRTVEIILDGALEDQWLSLKDQLAGAADEDVKTASLARPATTKVVEEMEAIRDKVLESQVFFVFERMDWKDRVALQVAHPPRDGNRLDTMQGFNIDTYTPAIIQQSCLGLAESEGDEVVTPVPEEKWLKLLGDPDKGIKGILNYGQVTRLFGAAHLVNEGLSKVPTSARSLLETRDSGASLAQPSPGQDPAQSGGKAGSRRGSRKSSTTKKAASAA